MRLLLVEDDQAIFEPLIRGLQREESCSSTMRPLSTSGGLDAVVVVPSSTGSGHR
jgi:hypothetical protein